MPKIRAIAGAFPANYCSQAEIYEVLGRAWQGHPDAHRFDAMRQRVGVEFRHCALPLAEYFELGGFSDANDAYLRIGTELAERAVRDALQRAELPATSVDHVFLVSVTGVATPSIDARLINALGMRSDVKRTPIFGLGCVGGAAGLGRAADYLRAFPDQVAVLVAVELCTLTFQPRDLSLTNLIAVSLFGDGAAAVVLTGDNVRGGGPEIAASRSRFYPDTLDVMGWQIGETGFKVTLSREVPGMVTKHLRSDVDQFLSDQGLSLGDIESFVVHPGGPKVLTAIEEALEIDRDALSVAWNNLRRIGNLSSVSVLINLKETLEQHRPRPGSYGLLSAMGPGFCGELVLLRW